MKDYNAKKNNNGSHDYTNSKKILSVPNIGPKIRKEFKKVKKVITFTSGKIFYETSYVKTNRSYSLIFILESTSWIFDTMVNMLVKEKEKSIDTLH